MQITKKNEKSFNLNENKKTKKIPSNNNESKINLIDTNIILEETKSN